MSVDESSSKPPLTTDPVPEGVPKVVPKTRMEVLCERYKAGEIDRATFVDEMLAVEWNPPRLRLPDELLGAGPGAQNSWALSRVSLPIPPDSLDELHFLSDIGLIDKSEWWEIYHRYKQESAERRKRLRESGGL